MKVKFLRGTVDLYIAKQSTYSTNGTVFFASDLNLIYANGITYGISDADADKINNSVSGVSINAADNTIKIDYTGGAESTYVTIANVTDLLPGLMTPSLKGNLETVYSDIVIGGTGTTKNKIVENKVNSTDGTITVTNGSTNSSTGLITGTNLAVNIDGTTLVKDNNGVISVDSDNITPYVGDDSTTTVTAVQLNGVTTSKKISTTLYLAEKSSNLGANSYKEYELVDANGISIANSSTIIIPKDSNFVGAYVGHMDDVIDGSTGVVTSGNGADALVFKYTSDVGEYSIVPMNVSDFLREGEFGNGLQVNNNIVSVKLKSSGENYLEIDSNGNLVSKGIDAAIAANKTVVNAKSTGFITVDVVTDPVTGTKTVTISESGISSTSDLSGETSRAEAAETAIDTAVGLTKDVNAETRSITPTTNYGTVNSTPATTVMGNLLNIDTALKNLSDSSISAVSVNGVNMNVSNGSASAIVDADDIVIDKTASSPGTTLNLGGTIKDTDSIKAAITALEASLLWYETPAAAAE